MISAQQLSGSSRPSVVSHVAPDLLGFFPPGESTYQTAGDLVQHTLHLTRADLAKLSHVQKTSVRFDHKMPQSVKERIGELANIANLVAEYFAGDARRVELWFTLPNPSLGNVSPRDMIRMGLYNKLLNFVLAAQDAERAPVPATGTSG